MQVRIPESIGDGMNTRPVRIPSIDGHVSSATLHRRRDASSLRYRFADADGNPNMKTRFLNIAVACVMIQICVTHVAWSLGTEQVVTPYPKMFSLDQYLMSDRNSEIALARSAAPQSISQDAGVLVLARHGYETVAQGKNGFVCLVQRSWTTGTDDPEFWNPKLRAPICFNAPAARSFLPIVLKRTELILSGRSKADMVAAIGAAFDSKELPSLEVGAMCYMMSKQGYLNDRDGHWYPHLMFFVPLTAPAGWGAGMPNAPVVGAEDKEDRLTVFMIPVRRWSDGTVADVGGH